MAPEESCSVCGRTILAGEQPRTYVTRDGEPLTVCELCRPRAEAAGWALEGRTDEPVQAAERPARGGRMRRFLDRARASAAIAATRPVREPSAAAPAEVERAAAEEGGPPSPAHRHSVPQSPERRMRRAFQRFNASEQRRMVRGLIRSLGEPSVSALSSPSAPAEVRITVAWELAWYQWEVDIARDDAPLRELARGDEIGELSEGDRRWNGRANSEGELSVGLEEPEPGDG